VGFTITREPASSLPEYARIPIAFEVRSVVYAIESPESPSRYQLVAREVQPFVKNYDAVDAGPLGWTDRFDVSRGWAFFIARDGERPVGAAACVYQAPGVDMLEGQPDVALLWDIRVAPDVRGRGIGRRLLAEVEQWCVATGARWLEVETQNINAPACRFYEQNGFELRAVDPHAYPELPAETQFLWYKRLPGSG
jgi:GNAT superfamily N-acetyltransferase